MALITDHSTIFSLVYFAGYTGQSSGSFGNQEFSFISTISIVDLNSVSKITTGFNVYYKMRGYNTSTQQYEDWHSMGEPLLIPPSGNSLTDISIITSWIDR